MRIAVAAALAVVFVGISPAHADAPKPLASWTPPQGRFFDDALAISADGTRVLAVATDAATVSSLHVYTIGGDALTVDQLPPTIKQVAFLGSDRVIAIATHEGDSKLVGLVATVKKGKDGKPTLTLDNKRLGPADAIDVVDREGKRLLTLYNKAGKKTTEHTVQLFDAATLKPIARRTFVESAEGALRTKAGEARPLWWTRGHTNLIVQKIGEYDKARDIRRPDRFVRLDLLTDKIVDEHEIEDVLGFAKVTIARKTAPPEEAYARLSEDHKQVLLLDGIDERPLPLARAIHLYDPDSLRSLAVDDKTLLVGLQVDPNNIEAVNRRGQDPDDFDLYTVDRSSLHGKGELTARRALVLPGNGRHVGFTAAAGKLAILRKDKGFDRGGVAVEFYALP
jgi:hypothetical protein